MADINNKKSSDQLEQKDNWYRNAAINAAVIGGMAFGISKMKGPFGKLLNSIQEEQRLKESSKAAEKAHRDSIASIIKDVRKDVGQDMSKLDPINPIINIGKVDMTLEASASLINDVKRIEQNILEFGNQALKSEYGERWVNSYNPTFDVLGKTDKEIEQNSAKYFTQLRHDTLLDFLSREPDLRHSNGESVYDFSKISSSATNEQYMAEVHEYYLKHSPEYAKLYQTKITRMKKDFWRFGAKSKIKTKASFKDYLYNSKFDGSSMTEAEIRVGVNLDQPTRVRKVYGGVVADRQGVQNFNILEEYHKGLLNEPNRWMSRYGDHVDTGLKKIDMISEFDYTGYLKGLAEVVEKLKNDPTSPIEDAVMHIETRGDSQYLRLGIQVKRQKTMEEIYIPISREGFMPGRSRSASKRYEAFFIRGNNLGMTPEDSILINKSQDIIRQITNQLDSAYINKASVSPHEFIKGLRRTANQYKKLPLAQGEVRNWAQLLSIHDDDLINLTINQKNAPPTKQSMLRNANASISNMHKIIQAKKAGRDVVLLGFDLETLGYGDLGPSKQAKDRTTQIHTAEISEFKIGANGKNYVSDTNTFYSDHVIDYMNKNNGWSTDVNIEWLRSVSNISADSSDEEVKAHFTKYIRSRSKDNVGRSKNNAQLIDKLLDQMIVKVQNANANGSDVKILTKNGAQFDLMLLRQFNPQKVDRLLKLAPHIDVQSLAYWEKESMHGQHSLSNKTLLQRTMGRQGLNPNIDIELEGGAGRYFKEITRKGNTIMDFAPQHHEKFTNVFSMKAHESPAVDNIATFHIFSQWLSETENGGGRFSTDHLNYLGKLVSMFGRNPDLLEMEEMTRRASSVKSKYGHNASMAMATSNQLAKMQLTFLDPSDMYVFPNIPHNKDIHQLLRGDYNLRVNPIYKSKMEGGAFDDARWMDKPAIQTEFAKVATSYMVGAHDRTQQYTKQLTYRTFYTAGLFCGREGSDKISLSAARMTEAHNMVRIALDDVTFDSMPELSQGIRKYVRDTKRYALAIARKRAKSRDVMPTFEDYQTASQIVPELRKYEIPAGSSLAVSQGDLGKKIIKSEIGGKIVGIDISRDLGNPDSTLPVISAKLELHGTLDQVGSFVSRAFGTKATTTTASDDMVYGAQRHAHADWLTKGYAGSASTIYLMTAIDDLRRKSVGDSSEAKTARQKLSKMANELGAKWTGETMILPHNKPSIKKLKHGVTADEQKMMRNWVGELDISFSQVLNYVKDAGRVWKDDDDLARNYYQFFSGWKGDARSTITAGRKMVESMITPKINGVIKSLDSATSEAGKVLDYFTDSGKSEVKSDIKTLYNAFYLPEVGGAKISEFRSPDGQISNDPTYSNHVLGAMVVDQFAQYGMNDGHRIREGSAKVRSEHIDNVRRNEFITNSLKEHILRNRRVDYSREHARAQAKLNQFVNALTARMSTTTEMSIDDINEIVSRKGNAQLAEKPGRIITDESHRQIKERIQNLAEMNAIPNDLVDVHVDEIVEDMQSNKLKDALLNPKTSWMSIYDVKLREKQAAKYGALDVKEFGKNTGVFRMSTGIKEGLTIDFERIINGGDEGKLKIDKKQLNTLMTYFEQTFKASKASGQEGIIKDVINEKRGGVLTQKIVLNQIVLPAMEVPDLMGNRISNELYLQSDLTKLSDEIMSYRVAIDKATKENKIDMVNANADKMALKQVQLLMHGLKITPDNLYSGNISELAGYRGRVTGVETVFHAAIIAKEKYKNMDKKMASKIDQILEQGLNTTFLAKSHLKAMPVRGVDGSTIAFAKYLEDNLGKDMAADVFNNKLPAIGFHARDPFSQSGKDAILDTKFFGIDDDVMEFMGVDKNVFYTSLKNELQNADYDGDDETFGIVNHFTAKDQMGKAAEFRTHIAEFTAIAEKTMTREDIISKNSWKVVGHSGNGMVSIAKFGKGLERKLVSVDSEEGRRAIENGPLSAGNKLFQNIAMDHVDRITPGYVQSRINMGAYNAMMKNQIGIVTNLIGEQLYHFKKADRVVDSVTSKFLIGDLSTGWTHISQKLLEFGKHGSPGDTSKFAKLVADLQNPKDRSKETEDFIESLFFDTIEKRGGSFDGHSAAELAKNATAEMFKVSEAVQRSFGGDSRKQAILGAFMDSNIRGKTNVLQYALTNSNDYMDAANIEEYIDYLALGRSGLEENVNQRSILGEIGDNLGKKFNVADMNFTVKKTGKYAAVGAAVFMAANFFRPNQMSNSLNPLDAYVNLGSDMNAPNLSSTDLQLDRRLPIDMVNASFSKEAFIKMQDNDRSNSNKEQMSKIIKDMLGVESKTFREYRSFKGVSKGSYSNSTKYIGYFGDSNIERRSEI